MERNIFVLASDHSGLELQNELKVYLKDLGFQTVDVGPYEYEHDDDYPDFIQVANKEVLERDCMGIYVCASGIGVSMAANRTRGIRAVNATLNDHAFLSRLHEDSNVLCLGQKFVSFDHAKEMFDIFIKTEFESGRHLRRI